METKRQLRDTITKLEYRVAELEERLCPYGKHDWVQVDSYLLSFTQGRDFDVVYKYKCRRCGKTKESM